MGKEANIFKRYEVKYLLTEEQYEELRERTKEHLIEDSYGGTTICNCYFDTSDYQEAEEYVLQGVKPEQELQLWVHFHWYGFVPHKELQEKSAVCFLPWQSAWH